MIELYKAHTIVPRFGGCKDVKLHWFVCSRNSSLHPPYRELITGPQCEGFLHAMDSIDEMFSVEEGNQLVAHLNENYPACANCMTKVELPISCKNEYPIGGLSFGGPTGVINLSENEKWNLQFKVSGYYDLRNYEPLPDRESDLLRRRLFVGGIIYINDGKVILASDLEEIAPLH